MFLSGRFFLSPLITEIPAARNADLLIGASKKGFKSPAGQESGLRYHKRDWQNG